MPKSRSPKQRVMGARWCYIKGMRNVWEKLKKEKILGLYEILMFFFWVVATIEFIVYYVDIGIVVVAYALFSMYFILHIRDNLKNREKEQRKK